MPNSILLLLIVLGAVAGVSGDAAGDAADPCAGRRIHIRPLPPRFNTHLLRHCDAAFPLADPSAATTSAPSCESLANHGLGPRTHARSHSWYRTDARLLEPFFHRRLLERGCLGADPAIADAVFVPYYAALDSLPYILDPSLLNSSALHGASLAQFLARDRPQILARRHGHDHFMVLAGTTRSRRTRSPVYGAPRRWSGCRSSKTSRSWPSSRARGRGRSTRSRTRPRSTRPRSRGWRPGLRGRGAPAAPR